MANIQITKNASYFVYKKTFIFFYVIFITFLFFEFFPQRNFELSFRPILKKQQRQSRVLWILLLKEDQRTP